MAETYTETSTDEISFLDLVNQIRTAPYSYAIGLGYTTDFLATRGISPETRLVPYVMDGYLNSRASDINNNRIEDNNSVYLLTTETMGSVSFINFMPVADAYTIFIENLFKKELDGNNFQYILSNNFSYAGVSIMTGIMENRLNAWFFALSLGSSVLKSDGQLLNLINQVRSEPFKIREYIELNLMELFRENRNIFYLLGNEYPPIFSEPSLVQAAQVSSYCMLNGPCPDPVAEDGCIAATPFEKSMYFGYKGLSAQEFQAVADFPKGDHNALVRQLFSTLVLSEFNTWPINAGVFSRDVQDAGLGISIRSGEEADLAFLSFYAGSGIQSNKQVPRIYGVLFTDKDENFLYSPGEEIPQMTILIYNEALELIESILTDNAGHFSVALDSKQYYTFKIDSDIFSITKKVFIDRDQFIKLIRPPSDL